MSFTVRMLPDLPVVLLTLTREYDLSTDFPKSYAAVTRYLDGADRPLYYITDLSAASFDLEAIIQGAAKLSSTSAGTFRHPKVKEALVVSPNDTLHYAAEGLQSEIYGNARTRAFYSLDDALAYVRTHCD